MSSEFSLLDVLRLLHARPSHTQREVAHELGMSLGKANYLLRALLGKGFVKVQNFRNSSNKRGYAYLLTPAGVAAKADLTRRFLAMKMEEYDRLRQEIERLRGESAADSRMGVDSLASVATIPAADRGSTDNSGNWRDEQPR